MRESGNYGIMHNNSQHGTHTQQSHDQISKIQGLASELASNIESGAGGSMAGSTGR